MHREDGKRADVYENIYNITGSDGVKTRCFRAAAVCLMLLCFLLLTAVVVLSVTFIQERQQYISKNDNLRQRQRPAKTGEK
ncbi:C-type lectin domain family 12 member B [Labeo rohita]|uniref:C-type lectin domain family 12 member B n=1 Tax=Labeo rohita TaxID=84645 RepID=A0ABQ8L284_LABRO|nr:C-type lectin domain family 12 member B [Labeo rohita]